MRPPDFNKKGGFHAQSECSRVPVNSCIGVWRIGDARERAVTAFEGARIIVGDGRAPIENGTLVVDGAKIAQVGSAASVQVPAGAARVNLAGKTVMPDLIDTHTHLSQTIEGLTQDLKRRAYYGVSAAHEHGHRRDRGRAADARPRPSPGMARLFTA